MNRTTSVNEAAIRPANNRREAEIEQCTDSLGCCVKIIASVAQVVFVLGVGYSVYACGAWNQEVTHLYNIAGNYSLSAKKSEVNYLKQAEVNCNLSDGSDDFEITAFCKDELYPKDEIPKAWRIARNICACEVKYLPKETTQGLSCFVHEITINQAFERKAWNNFTLALAQQPSYCVDWRAPKEG